ncbi:MAG: trigger factor, partial [Pseudomonadota bacterium]|nr:trigger factor [Pseudomonadota bacterium]
LVKGEFDAIWKQVIHELEHAGKTFKDEDTTEEKAREEYQKLARRRVRLGLVLAEIGDKNEVKVTDDEVNNALMARIRQFPGQERQVFEFYKNNPQAMADIRAPLFEEKVVDFILELADVTEKKVDSEELFKPMDDDKS